MQSVVLEQVLVLEDHWRAVKALTVTKDVIFAKLFFCQNVELITEVLVKEQQVESQIESNNLLI